QDAREPGVGSLLRCDVHVALRRLERHTARRKECTCVAWHVRRGRTAAGSCRLSFGRRKRVLDTPAAANCYHHCRRRASPPSESKGGGVLSRATARGRKEEGATIVAAV